MTPNPEIISFHRLRQFIGILGMGLPFVLLIGTWILSISIQPSISFYYGTDMRNILEGVLFVTGVFLICYFGYDWRDTIMSWIAGFAALGIALFPCTIPGLVSTTHYVCAAIFFLSLAVFCLWLFPMTKKDGSKTQRKTYRNRLYRICGLTILAVLVLIAVWDIFFEKNPPAWSTGLHPVFWLESIANLAFGLSWLVKGGVVMRDLPKS